MGRQASRWMLSLCMLFLLGCTQPDETPRPAAVTGLPSLPVPERTTPEPLPALLVNTQPPATSIVTSFPTPAIPTDKPRTAPTVPPEPSSPILAPLTREAMAACPVSLPNLTQSPDEHYISARSGYGNARGTMFFGLWPGGVVTFRPDGPGQASPDGSLAMKFWFYRTVPGEVVIGGRRLDAAAPPMPQQILRGKADGYGETGFHPSGLVFPGEGCWEVSAAIGEEKLTFVTLVLKLLFEPLLPTWLPDGLEVDGVDLTNFPPAFRYTYGFQNGGEISVETTRGLREPEDLEPQAVPQPVKVKGASGVCVQGARDAQGEWQAGADVGVLEWAGEGLRYRIQQAGLGLGCADLLRIAGS